MWSAELTCWSSLMRTTVPPSWSAWPGMIAATSTSASHPSQNEGVPMDPSSMSRRSASEPMRAWPKLWTSWSLSNRTIQAGKGFLLSSHGTLNLNDPIVETFFQGSFKFKGIEFSRNVFLGFLFWPPSHGTVLRHQLGRLDPDGKRMCHPSHWRSSLANEIWPCGCQGWGTMVGWNIYIYWIWWKGLGLWNFRISAARIIFISQQLWSSLLISQTFLNIITSVDAAKMIFV